MVLFLYAAVFAFISSVTAAGGGDDDWVHLPNKCEGNDPFVYTLSGG